MNHKLPKEKLLELAAQHGTPLYINSLASLNEQADILLGLNLPFGYMPRYAAKANMNPDIIGLFNQKGIQFDASSSYEVMELMKMGVEAEKISLSSQQPAHNLEELLELGVLFVATSMHQLGLFMAAENHPGKVGLRINPGVGAGGTNRTTTGGENSSFGLWHEYLNDALALCDKNNVAVDRLHIHYGSGANPDIWEKVIKSSLNIVKDMPGVTSLDIGGGFKVCRYEGEQEADMGTIGAVFSAELEAFAAETGRKISLELEPGTWLVAHAGTLVAQVADIVDTGPHGRTFLRLNTGMNDLIRPTMYGAQHQIEVLNNSEETKSYVVVGHNCESGDILTPAPGNPEEIAERVLHKATIGDVVAIYDTGAYGRYFAVAGYNSFPSAKEITV
ncbi:MAG: Diaminopimelate decarboxylase [Candidatus Saccharibacteria bacterium]|nr:Diaminopimelate decarboxylase [Candidatus Saccharibacteria bacterium]